MTARPASILPAAFSSWPPDPPATTPATPSSKSTLSAGRGSPAPYLPAPSPPAVTSDSLLKPALGSLPGSETAGPSDPRASAAAAPSSEGVPTLAFQPPVFPGVLSPVPGLAASSPGQHLALPAPAAAQRAPAAAQLDVGLVSSTSPASTFQVLTAQPPRSSSKVIPGLTPLPPTGAASFSPDTGLIFPFQQRPSLPAVHRIAVGSQVSYAAQVTPGGRVAESRGKRSPVSTSALVCARSPTLSLSHSSLAPTPPRVPLQPAFGDEQKQPALTPTFCSPLLSRNWAVTCPNPVSQSALGGGVLSAPTSQVPAHCLLGLAFGGTTQSQSGVGDPVFGSKAPRPFAFGGSVTPMECGEPGVTMSTNSGGSSSGAVSPGGTLLRGVPSAGSIFESRLSQNRQCLPTLAFPSSLGRTGFSAKKLALGVLSSAPFAQSSWLPGPAKLGCNVGTGLGLPPAGGSASRGGDPFRSPACFFSIGSNPKSPRSREHERSQRHLAHRK
ncbi:POM121-like protein 2 [Octodon degus]|uniref:POM121-like protein 2 n=1 Tax=Octodon degus TaxID=10160 RepID=A0A6P3F3C5_OCTDE|nr:POM121-like protein 2 [Octodon degus]